MAVPEQIPDPKSREKAEVAQDLTEITLKAAQFYKAQLKTSEKAIAYLRKRGLTGEVAARYGLVGEESSRRELGTALGISAERVRQVEARALDKLGCAAGGPDGLLCG